jgi:tripartite-type tricarboxylate transporter receptor subunit TctC
LILQRFSLRQFPAAAAKSATDWRQSKNHRAAFGLPEGPHRPPIRAYSAYAKANPGKINMGTAGVGSASHLYGELFKKMAGVDLLHVPYRGGGAALVALLGGEVQVYFGPVLVSIANIRAGKLRPLGVTTTSRIGGLPDVPPISDFVPGYEAIAWFHD